MSNFLKQSTASQSRAIGPFLDDTDFKTAETGLTIANTDIKLIVNGGASADKNSGGGTHRANGMYGITFDATDTATVGELEVSVKVAGALPVFKTFFVLEEAVYDALFAASAPGYGTAQTGDSFARIGATGSGLTSLATQASVNTIDDFLDTEIAAIKAKTDNLPTDPADASDVAAAIAALNDLSAAEVNAEVVDALATDTYAEITGVPAFTVSLSAMIRRLYAMAINGVTVTSSKKQFLNAAGVAQFEKDLSDNGTTYAETNGNAP